MTYAAVAIGGANLIGGYFSSKSSKKLQKEALALQRQQLEFAQKRYADNQALYGDLKKQTVADAQAGVQADLGGVTSRATGDVASAFANAEAERQRNMQRLGISADSGRADAMANQNAIEKALAQAGNVTTQREQERRRAADETFARRQWATQLGVSELSGDAAGITNAYGGMANTLNNGSNQQAAAAGNFFSGAGQALGMGLAMYKPKTMNTPITQGIPTTNVDQSVVYQRNQSAIKNANLITDLQSGNNPTLAAFGLGANKAQAPNQVKGVTIPYSF